MANQPLKGVPRLKAALGNSIQGFRDIWRSEEAFRLECIALILSLPLAFLVTDGVFHAAILIASLLFLLIIEALNSAIEAVVDRIGTERHELSRMAKDYGSLAVFLAMALAGLLWAAALFDAFFGTV